MARLAPLMHAETFLQTFNVQEDYNQKLNFPY